jgi:predicted phosphohydrolase
MVGYYLTWLDTLFAHCSVLFVPGNHDKWYPNVKTSDRWSNLADLSLVYRYHGTTKVPYMVTFPGVNYEGPSWARHHDEEEMDLNPVVEQIYAARPRVVATHYPFWWADETVDSMLDVAIYTSGVKKVVFGHLHSVADWLDACSTSPLPDVDLYYVAAVGREQPLTLVDWINE